MTLRDVWFVIVAFFWTGFFVLEGFDFGVGALHKLVGRTDVERRVAINTIGPVWDGNEVWLVVAGAAMFAAFPGWYASWFSALYLALWLLLAALIIRGVSFEFRGSFDATRVAVDLEVDPDHRIGAGAVLFGVGLGDLLAGLPIDADEDFTGTFWDSADPVRAVRRASPCWRCACCTARPSWRSAAPGRCAIAPTAPPPSPPCPAVVLLVGFAVWTPSLSAHRPCAASLPPVLAGRRRARRRALPLRAAARPGVRRHRGRHRRDRRVALRQPVPERADLHHRRRLHPDRHEHLVQATTRCR